MIFRRKKTLPSQKKIKITRDLEKYLWNLRLDLVQRLSIENICWGQLFKHVKMDLEIIY
jgi:hypothetical protein